MVELLKQGQYEPMKVYDQIIGLFAGAGGFLDQLEVSEVLPFESFLIGFIKDYPDKVYEQLQRENKLSDDLRARLTEACKAALNAWKEKAQNALGLG
jgi:F-type H+-transporting ATPase subunit alpha